MQKMAMLGRNAMYPVQAIAAPPTTSRSPSSTGSVSVHWPGGLYALESTTRLQWAFNWSPCSLDGECILPIHAGLVGWF